LLENTPFEEQTINQNPEKNIYTLQRKRESECGVHFPEYLSLILV
jgi:hypothetical protein